MIGRSFCIYIKEIKNNMHYLNNYYQFINESKENVFDELSNILIDRFKTENDSFIIDEYSKISSKRRFKIKNLQITFFFRKDSENFCNGLCNITNSKIENDYLIDTSISFNIGYLNLDNDFIKYIHSVIKHEVFHLYQVYNLKINNKFKPESWVIGSLIPTFRNYLKTEYSQDILHTLYLSLSHEIYSQLQQYYFYKKDNLNYQKIKDMILELNNFKVKSNLDNYEIIEINNIKKYIFNGLKKNNNKKYNKNVDESLWNEQDINLFLTRLKQYFEDKAKLIEVKLKKIDLELNFENKINESLDKWISLPSNFENTEIDHYDIIDDMINDILY